MDVKHITSPDNPTFKSLESLSSSRGIKKQGMAILSGPKQVNEVLKGYPDRVSGIIFTRNQSPPEEPEKEGDIVYYNLSPELFRRLDFHGTKQPLLLVHAEYNPLVSEKESPAGCTLCIPFQDPSNVGAVIRAAAAFGVSRAVILEDAAHPFLPRSIRAAGSTLFQIPMFKGPPLRRLKFEDLPLITLSPDGQDIGQFTFPPAFCLVTGLEGPGLPPTLKGASPLAIPIEGKVESLNAAMAAGIALYVWRQGLKQE